MTGFGWEVYRVVSWVDFLALQVLLLEVGATNRATLAKFKTGRTGR